MQSGETKKRKYKVRQPIEEYDIVEADQLQVTASGVLVFYERGLARHPVPNRIVEAFAPGTWSHVKEISNE